jgi:hypothetical protein
MNGMHESEYRGVKIRVTYGVDTHGAVEAWRIFLDDEELHCTTTDDGVYLLGFSYEYPNPEAADNTMGEGDPCDALLDPASVSYETHAPGKVGNITVAPVSEGRGRVFWVSGEPDWNIEAIPIQLVRPYIDHLLQLRVTYQHDAFEQLLVEELHRPRAVPAE